MIASLIWKLQAELIRFVESSDRRERTFVSFRPRRLPNPMFFCTFPRGACGGIHILFFPKWHLAQGRGSAWVKDGAEPGPETGINQPGMGLGRSLDQRRSLAWTRHRAQQSLGSPILRLQPSLGSLLRAQGCSQP